MRLAYLRPAQRDGHTFFQIVPDRDTWSPSSGHTGTPCPVAPALPVTRGVMTTEPGPQSPT